MNRSELLSNWIAQQFPGEAPDIQPASADASFRRYFRASAAGKTHIVMDAPPEHEDCRPFVAVAKLFGDAGVNVPKVLAQDRKSVV